MSKYHLPAEEVRRIRRSLGETQAELAKRLCVDSVTVARWETDQRKCTGLYAKTITELDPKNSLLTKGRLEMEGKQELIRTIELHQLYRLMNELKPILQFLYKEVPLERRRYILERYQQFFHNWKSDNFFEETFNSKLLSAIKPFCIVIIPIPVSANFLNEISSTKYQDEKLSKSYRYICEAAKELAPNSSIFTPEFPFQTGHIGDMFLDIKSALDDLLKQPNLKEEDIAILKFFRSLVQFALKERNARKFLPIPEDVSFSFARFISALFNKKTRILVAEFDDLSQRESLREQLEIGDEVLLAAAVKLYELGRLSSGAAATLAGIPRVVFLSKLAEYGVDTFRLTEAELAEDLANA